MCSDGPYPLATLVARCDSRGRSSSDRRRRTRARARPLIVSAARAARPSSSRASLARLQLESITDSAAKIRRLVELNVEEQCINVLKSGVVQQRRIETYCDVENQQFAKPRIHGLVYDPGTGKLRDLGVNFPTEGVRAATRGTGGARGVVAEVVARPGILDDGRRTLRSTTHVAIAFVGVVVVAGAWALAA